jgi:hypothetical protein
MSTLNPIFSTLSAIIGRCPSEVKARRVDGFTLSSLPGDRAHSPTSAPGLGPPLPHLRRDRAQPTSGTQALSGFSFVDFDGELLDLACDHPESIRSDDGKVYLHVEVWNLKTFKDELLASTKIAISEFVRHRRPVPSWAHRMLWY